MVNKTEDKRDIIFIEHVLESITAIEQFLEKTTKEELCSSRLKQSAIVREVEIIGEAVKNVSNALKLKYPDVEWKNIVHTRDKLIHHYFGVDLNIVWNIVKKDLPVLKKQIEKIKKELSSQS